MIKNSTNLIFAAFVFFAILVGSVYINYPGIVHPEAELRIPRYLDNRPLLTKIFDVNVNDSTWYQARELSYIFEISDAYFIRGSARLGFPHFLSLSNYLSVLLLSLLIVFISFRYFKQRHPAIPLLLGVLLLTSPAVFLGVFFFRSSKEILSLVLVVLVLFILRYLRKGTGGFVQTIPVLIISVAATLLDRQGFYLITLFSVISLLIFFYAKNNRYYKLFLIFLAASLINVVYNIAIGPVLIHHFAGYWPDFNYQLGSGKPSTLTEPVNFFAVVSWPQLMLGATYFFQTFSFLLGNIPLYLLIPLFVSFCWLLYISFSRKFGSIILLFVIAMVFLNSVMLLRHTGMLMPDVVRLYYMLPAYTLFILAANYALAGQWIAKGKNSLFATSVLFVLCLLNIAALPTHNAIIRSGIFIQKHVAVTPETIRCIRHVEKPVAAFNLPWVQNTILCEALRNTRR